MPVLLLLALPLAGCLGPDAPAAAVVPAEALVDAPGTLAIENTTYDLGVMLTQTRTLQAPALVRVQGQLYHPLEGDGPFPVVVLMHGNHFTCRGTPSVGTCRDTPVSAVERSHEGYGVLAEDLAARGFVVLSINANDINDQNFIDDLGAQQRAQLYLRTLDELRAAHAGDGPLGPALEGRLDLERVGLMGHSRGGDGAARTLALNAERAAGERHTIQAIFALAPTDFTRHDVTGVAFATLLPYCDGDVWNLQGAWMFDDARHLPAAGPLHQYTVMGANHNWFNGVWHQDDARWVEKGSECDAAQPTRLSGDAQRELGRAIMGGFFRRYLADERALDPYLLAGTDGVHASHVPPKAERLDLDDTLAESTNAQGGAVQAFGFKEAKLCTPAAASYRLQPVFLINFVLPTSGGTCPSEPITSTATQRTLAWTGPATLREELPGIDASSFTALTFRMGVDFRESNGPQDLRVIVRDVQGREASVLVSAFSDALYLPPGGDDMERIVLNEVRIPLSAFAGVDLADVRAIDLVFDATPKGRVQLADLMLQ